MSKKKSDLKDRISQLTQHIDVPSGKTEVTIEDIVPKEGTMYGQLVKDRPSSSKYATIKMDAQLLNEVKRVAEQLGYGSRYGKVLDAIIRAGLQQLNAEAEQ